MQTPASIALNEQEAIILHIRNGYNHETRCHRIEQKLFEFVEEAYRYLTKHHPYHKIVPIEQLTAD